MKDHAIIIGWNDFGRNVVQQLINARRKVAVVTNSKDNIDLIQEIYDSKQVFTLFSDLNNFELLKKVNPEDSSIVFINLEDDTQKLVYILNMRKFFGELHFVVTLDNGNLRHTFHSAGVTHTVSKNEISSKLLASYIYEPDVAHFSEDIMSYAQRDEDHDIKQFKIIAGNPFLGKTYNHTFADLKKNYNSVLIGITKVDGNEKKLLKNPDEDILVEEGDYLIMLMNLKAFKAVSRIFKTDEGLVGEGH